MAAKVRAMSPLQVWKGYDPRKEPLDEEIVRQWTRAGCRYKEVYFTGETFEGEPVRVYAMYAAPIGGKGRKTLPGMLHVHGGGQTVDPRWLRFWTRRGYAVLTFDWGGNRPPREKYTLWGKIKQGNHFKLSNGRLVEPTPRINSWYHWTLVSRRALTYLERQDEVDPERLGAFGISMGGTLMWNLAVDERVKAGCAIYGAGWNSYGRDPKHVIGGTSPKPTEADRLWRASLAPEAYAPLVRFPMLFLSATNDTHGNMDRAYDTLAAIPSGVPRSQALTPRFIHHVGTAESRSLPIWMDRWLKGEGDWPAAPKTEVRVSDDGAPVFAVTPDAPDTVKKVEILYAVENPWPVSRHWRDAACRRQPGTGRWQGPTPVMDASKYLFAFANVHYRSGACLSTEMAAVIPATLDGAKATDRRSNVLFDGTRGLDGWLEHCRGTEPCPPFKAYMRLAKGPGGRKGIAIRPTACTLTYKPGDPKWRAPAGAALCFDVAAAKREKITVTVIKDANRPAAKRYAAETAVNGSTGWRTVTLAPTDFAMQPKGGRLKSWRGVNMLEIRRSGGKSDEIIVSNVRWERPGG